MEEAVEKVKDQAKQKMTGGKKGIGRRGAVKKAFRGRLKMSIVAIGPDKPISLLVVKVESARDLEPLECNAYVQMKLVPDPNNPGKEPELKQTKVRPKTKHPIYNDQFQWEVQSQKVDLEATR